MEYVANRHAAPDLPPMPLPQAARPVRIRNRRYGTYLYEANNQVRYCGPEAVGAGCTWQMEDFRGSKRFTNRVTGHSISIEHQFACVESIPVKDCWLSACWTLEAVPGGILIRSVWHNWHLLHIDVQDGFAQYGGAVMNPDGAVWVLEDGA